MLAIKAYFIHSEQKVFRKRETASAAALTKAPSPTLPPKVQLPPPVAYSTLLDLDLDLDLGRKK
ncbi:unnamed protein product [Caretta caretta]